MSGQPASVVTASTVTVSLDAGQPGQADAPAGLYTAGSMTRQAALELLPRLQELQAAVFFAEAQVKATADDAGTAAPVPDLFTVATRLLSAVDIPERWVQLLMTPPNPKLASNERHRWVFFACALVHCLANVAVARAEVECFDADVQAAVPGAGRAEGP